VKLLALALLTAVGFAGVVSSHDALEARRHAQVQAQLQAHYEAVAHGELSRDDEPPPVDCPFCGGNPTQHLRNMRRMFVFQSRLILGAALVR
jgi:hypothetical protein